MMRTHGVHSSSAVAWTSATSRAGGLTRCGNSAAPVGRRGGRADRC